MTTKEKIMREALVFFAQGHARACDTLAKVDEMPEENCGNCKINHGVPCFIGYVAKDVKNFSCSLWEVKG